MPTTSLAAADPAGGAALDQVATATGGAAIATAVLLWLAVSHHAGRSKVLERLTVHFAKATGLPRFAGLPLGVAAVALLVALLGMYWDISLHIDEGRDAGPLANPSHYLILFGLYGIFAAGVLACAIPRSRGEAGPAPLSLPGGIHAPVGGVLMATAGGFALTGFPLDDVWHRLFGQDVTLWGPTHLMLIGGAGLTLVGQSVLLAEAVHARRTGTAGARDGRASNRLTAAFVQIRRLALGGGLLIGLSTFQAEFDFGVPQFHAAFQPLLMGLAAGGALVFSRVWVGPGGALMAFAFFFVVRGGVSLLVGGPFGQTTPSLALYLPAALCVEAAALLLVRSRSRRRASAPDPVRLGLLSGVLIGTVGLAGELAWTHLTFRIPMSLELGPWIVVLGVVGGVAGGLAGALLGAGLRGQLPARRVALPAALASLVLVLGSAGTILAVSGTSGAGARVELARAADGTVTARFSPASASEGAHWRNLTAWQGGGLAVRELRPTATPGVLRTDGPVPVGGDWKALLRVHRGNQLTGAALALPADAAIPAPAVPLPRAGQSRAIVSDHGILQREKKDDIPAWLWAAAGLTVLAISLGFLLALAWGVARVGRAIERDLRSGTGAGAAPPSGAPSPRPRDERRAPRDRRVASPTPA